MTERSGSPNSASFELDPRVIEVAEEFTSRLRNGEQVPVEEYTNRYPNLADQISHVFAAIQIMSRVAPDENASKEAMTRDPVDTPGETQTSNFQPSFDSGRVINNRYTLQQKLGEGGMGEVWVAKQSAPVKRKVALKVIKTGMDSRAVLERFEQERQALAMMDHPHIARVLDGGMTDSGQPFFVMELVNGLPVSKFCDETKLSLRERLELFVPICQAVQHAHQKGIIHRDLKPANILVTVVDGKPIPKVIDFGVAKAVSGKLTEHSISTQFGAVVGTLEYMSPEQAGYSGVDVDTRADIYSLGVILYELLTGLKPHDGQRLRKAAFNEMIRIIQEEEPSKPSTKLSTDESLPSLAAVRQTDPKRLVSILRGELDWIVLKCLEKSRDRRYETVNGLAREIERFLNDEPVEARPPSLGYRLGKLARRNKAALLASGAVAIALVAGIIGTSYQAVEATRARRATAKQVVRADEERDRAVSAENEARAEQRKAMRQSLIAGRNQYISHMQQVRLEWASGNVGRVRELLNVYRPGNDNDGLPDNFSDPRGWEWYYWDRMCHSDLRTLRGHEGKVYSVAFNKDGSILASAGADGTVRIWQTATGRQLASIDAHEGYVLAVAFHPAKDLIASVGTDKKAVIWNANNGNKVRVLEHDAVTTAIAFSRDGTRLAVGTDGSRTRKSKRVVWNVDSGERLSTYERTERITSIAFSTNDSSLYCTTSGSQTEIWNLDDGTLSTYGIHTELKDNGYEVKYTRDLAVSSKSPDYVASASKDGTAKLWSVSNGEVKTTFSEHRRPVNAVAYSPNGGRLATAGDDNAIRVWDAETGNETLTLRGHSAPVLDIAYSPKGYRIASASSDGTVKIWDANQSSAWRLLNTRNGSHMLEAQFAPSSYQIAYSKFHGLGEPGNDKAQYSVVQNVAQQNELREFHGGHGAWVRALAFSRDGKLLATGGGCTVQIWDTDTGRKRVSIDGSQGPEAKQFRSVVNSGLQFGKDDQLVLARVYVAPSGQPDSATTTRPKLQLAHRVYNANTGKLLFELKGKRSVRFNPKEPYLVDVCDRILSILEPETGIEIQKCLLDAPSSNPVFSDNGALLATQAGTDVTIWDVRQGKQILKLPNAGNCISLDSKDNRIFTTTRESVVKVWHLASGDLMCDVRWPSASVYGTVTLSHDRKLLAAKAMPVISLLDTRPVTPSLAVEQEGELLCASMLRMPMAVLPSCMQAPEELLDEVDRIKTVSGATALRCKTLLRTSFTDEVAAEEFAWAAVYLADGQDPTTVWKPEPEAGPTKEQVASTLQNIEMALSLSTDSFVQGVCGISLALLGRYSRALPLLQEGYKNAGDREIRFRAELMALIAVCQFHENQVDKAKRSLEIAKADRFARMGEAPRFIAMAEKLLQTAKN